MQVTSVQESSHLPLEQSVPTSNPILQLLREHDAFREMCYELTGLVSRWTDEAYSASITAREYASLLRCRETIREHLNVHLVKEEEIFFPRLEKLVPQGRVKFLFLNYDHEFLRQYFDGFCDAISRFDEDKLPMHLAIKEIVRTGRLIVDNLLQHILAEDTVYFALAESGFDPHELEQMGQEMLALEHRLREH